MFGCVFINSAATFSWVAFSDGSPQKPQVIVTCWPVSAAAVGCVPAAGAAVGAALVSAAAVAAAPPAAGALVAAPPVGVVAPPHAASTITAITSSANICANRRLCM